VAFAVSLPLSMSGMEIALGVMLVLCGVGLMNGYRRFRRTPVDVPILVVLAALLLSTIVRGVSADTLDAYRELWIISAYVCIAVLVTGVRETENLVRIMVLTSALVAVYGIVQHFTGIDLYRDLTGRRTEVEPLLGETSRFIVVGFFPNPLTYAYSLIIPLGWAVAGSLGPARWVMPRSVAAAAAGIMLLALLFSTARGAWIAAAVVGVLACIISSHWRGLLALAGAGLLALVVFGTSSGLRAEARSIIDGNANSGRFAIYAANLEMLRDHPILGLGFGSYDTRAQQYYDRHPKADRRSHAHNSFLQMAATAGVVGLAAFCYLFGTVIRLGWRLQRRVRESQPRQWPSVAGAWLGIVGFLIGAMTQDTFGDSECALAMWFAVGVLVVVDRCVRMDRHEPAHLAR
jgi:O-antigen ligase